MVLKGQKMGQWSRTGSTRRPTGIRPINLKIASTVCAANGAEELAIYMLQLERTHFQKIETRDKISRI